MRPLMLPTLLLVLTSSAGGCAGCGQQPAAVQAAGSKPGAAASRKPQLALEGYVRATATLLSDKGGGVVSNNGAAIVSNNGGAFRLAAEAWLPVRGAEVTLVGADGKPLPGVAPVKTDATGRYRLQAPEGAYVVRAKANAATLGTYVTLAGAGTKADLTPSTTVSAAYVLQRSASQDLPLSRFSQRSFDALVASVDGVLTAGRVPIDLTTSAAALKTLEAAAAAEAQVQDRLQALGAPAAASPPAASPVAPAPTPTPDPLAGELVAPLLAEPRSLVVAPDLTVYYTTDGVGIHAVTPTGDGVPTAIAMTVASELVIGTDGRLLAFDPDQKRCATIDLTTPGFPKPVDKYVIYDRPMLADGPAFSSNRTGRLLIGHTLIEPGGAQSDTQATMTGLQEARQAAGQTRLVLTAQEGSAIWFGYAAPQGGTTLYRTLPGGQVQATVGAGAAFGGARVDGQNRLLYGLPSQIKRRTLSGPRTEDVATGSALGAFGLAPDGTLYFADGRALRRIKPPEPAPSDPS